MATESESLIEILKKLVNELKPKQGENIKITLEKV